MKPDIVYIYNHECSKWFGREIIYSLRSLEQYGKNFGKVIIVGDKPSTLNENVIHIPKQDEAGNKERRIYEKLLTACNSELVSDPFVMFNDDYFLSKDINFPELEYFYADTLEIKILNKKDENTYKRALINTREALLKKGYGEKHYDIHYPMLIHKKKFIESMKDYDWEIRGGYVVKSLYVNSAEITPGKYKHDCKIRVMYDKNVMRGLIENTEVFSTGTITRPLGELLKEFYQLKSIYET